MWIFQFPCPLGFAIILQGSGSAQSRVQLGVAPPGMIYITILSLLAPLVTAGVKGFGIIFSVSWDLNGNGKKTAGRVWSWENYKGPTETNATTFPPKKSPTLLRDDCGDHVFFFCEPSSLQY